jgi:hypothetical protein
MADEYLYSGVPIALRDRGEYVEIGAVIEGGFFAFGAYKTGGFNDDLAEAREAQAKAQADRPAPGTTPPAQV